MDIGKVQPCVELNFQCMESAFTESCEVICNEASNSDPLCNLSVKIGADIDVEGDEESRPVAFHKAQTKVTVSTEAMCKEIRLTSGSESSESITLGTSVDSIFTPRVATQEKESNPATAQDNTQVVKTEPDKSNAHEKNGWKENGWTVIQWIVIATIWVLIVLPLVFYHIQVNSETEANTDISAISANSTCTSEVYTGLACQDPLKQYQLCLPGRWNDEQVHIPSRGNQNDLEQQVNVFFGIGVGLLNPSEDCYEALVPFVCFYTFGLCDGNGDRHLPSLQHCQTIITATCASEFLRLSSFGEAVQGFVPQCDILPLVSIVCSDTAITSSGDSSGLHPILTNDNATIESESSSTTTTNSTLVCSDGFYVLRTGNSSNSPGVCLPECGEWEEFPHNTVVALDTTLLVAAFMYMIGGTMVLVVSFIRCQRMFSFPSVFIIYGTVSLSSVMILLSVSLNYQKELFCSSSNLFESIDNPTMYCTATGVLFNYIIVETVFFWLCHIVVIFWSIHFPFHFRSAKNRGYTKYVHFLMVVVAVLLPTISCGIPFATGDYTMTRFPPYQCLARHPDTTYYTVILPTAITLAVGISLIVIVFRTVIGLVHMETDGGGRHSLSLRRYTPKRLFKRGRLHNSIQIGTAEIKILVILFYYFIISMTSLISFTISSRIHQTFADDLATYFACEATGISPGKDCDKSFGRLGPDILGIVNYILLGLYPFVYLIYVVNLQELKTKLMGFHRIWGRIVTGNATNIVSRSMDY